MSLPKGRTFAAILAVVTLAMALCAANAFADGWILMLAIGVGHSLGWPKRTLGFWPCVGIGFLLSALGVMVFGRRSAQS